MPVDYFPRGGPFTLRDVLGAKELLRRRRPPRFEDHWTTEDDVGDRDAVRARSFDDDVLLEEVARRLAVGGENTEEVVELRRRVEVARAEKRAADERLDRSESERRAFANRCDELVRERDELQRRVGEQVRTVAELRRLSKPDRADALAAQVWTALGLIEREPVPQHDEEVVARVRARRDELDEVHRNLEDVSNRESREVARLETELAELREKSGRYARELRRAQGGEARAKKELEAASDRYDRLNEAHDALRAHHDERMVELRAHRSDYVDRVRQTLGEYAPNCPPGPGADEQVRKAVEELAAKACRLEGKLVTAREELSRAQGGEARAAEELACAEERLDGAAKHRAAFAECVRQALGAHRPETPADDEEVLRAVESLAKKADRLAAKLDTARRELGRRRSACWSSAYGMAFVDYLRLVLESQKTSPEEMPRHAREQVEGRAADEHALRMAAEYAGAVARAADRSLEVRSNEEQVADAFRSVLEKGAP